MLPGLLPPEHLLAELMCASAFPPPSEAPWALHLRLSRVWPDYLPPHNTTRSKSKLPWQPFPREATAVNAANRWWEPPCPEKSFSLLCSGHLGLK